MPEDLMSRENGYLQILSTPFMIPIYFIHMVLPDDLSTIFPQPIVQPVEIIQRANAPHYLSNYGANARTT
jgi:hypothetical protein